MLIEQWSDLALSSRRPSYRREAVRALSVAFADYMKRRADGLTRADAVKTLERLVKAGKTAIAGRTLAYGRACYNWALKRGKVPANPFLMVPIATGTVSRDRVLSDAEVALVWQLAPNLGWPFGPLMEVLLLTAQRREEVAGMTWSEVSPDLTTWTIRKERAKNGRAHVVHLAAAARAILADLPRLAGVDLVFTTNGKTAVSGFRRAKSRLDTLIEGHLREEAVAAGVDPPAPVPPWRAHDFRRTAVTWMAGNGVAPHVADRLLNHVGGTITGVAAVYQRAEFMAERKAALEAWGRGFNSTSPPDRSRSNHKDLRWLRPPSFDSPLTCPYTVDGNIKGGSIAMGDPVDAAVASIVSGSAASDCESPELDFKEDPGSIGALDTIITKAAVCFANAAGGTVVIGISDKLSGPDAIKGTAANPEVIRQRIYELTKPPILVNVEVRQYVKRVLLIKIHAGSAVHSDNSGRSWQRINTSCLPLQPGDQARLAQERAGFDWSSGISAKLTSDVSPEALSVARDLLRRLPDDRQQISRQPDEDLLRSLGVISETGRLNKAGEVLFCSVEQAHPLLVYQYKMTPGGEPRAVQRLGGPMVQAYLRIMDSFSARQSTTPVAMPNGQQITIEDFPTIAVREALSNALCHRDWQITGAVTVDHSPEVFTIVSPGPLVAGVTPENILTMPSRPRNRVLAATIRLLGLAEETGRGVDRMYRETIRSGRQPPNIEAFLDRVSVSFVGGAPDTNIARFVARLPESEREDTDTMLLLYHLCRFQNVTAAQAAPLLQKPAAEAAAVLRRLSVEPVLLLESTRHSKRRSQPVYRLREEVIRGLGAAVIYNRRTLDEFDRKIIEHIREYGKITNRTLQNMFDVHVFRARDILSSLQSRELVARISEQSRGTKVEWGPGVRFPKSRARKSPQPPTELELGSRSLPEQDEASHQTELTFPEIARRAPTN